MSQEIPHMPVGARVPEKVNRGVFSTAVMILQSGDEFVVDFLATMVHPQQVVARVVLAAPTFNQLVAALRTNVAGYEEKFGKLSPRGPAAAAKLPSAGGFGPAPAREESSASSGGEDRPVERAAEPPAQPAQPALADLYDQLRLPDDLLGGVYANVVMIRHTPEEFAFDFIANFYPRPVVTARVFVAAGRIPSLVDTMADSWEKYRQRPHGGPPPK